VAAYPRLGPACRLSGLRVGVRSGRSGTGRTVTAGPPWPHARGWACRLSRDSESESESAGMNCSGHWQAGRARGGPSNPYHTGKPIENDAAGPGPGPAGSRIGSSGDSDLLSQPVCPPRPVGADLEAAAAAHCDWQARAQPP
jgi:hypothetical protein